MKVSALGIFFGSLLVVAAAGEQLDAYTSSTCVQASACSTHRLACGEDDVRIRSSDVILLLNAWNGFLWRNDNYCRHSTICAQGHYCCQDNPNIVCKQELSASDFAAVSAECSGRRSCGVEAANRSTDVGDCSQRGVSRDARAISSIVQFACIPEYTILTTAKQTSASAVPRFSLRLEKDMFSSSYHPFHTGSCTIATYRTGAYIVIYSYAVRPSAGRNDWSVTVRDVTQTVYIFNASQPSHGKKSSVETLLGIVRTPARIDVRLEADGYPDLVWFGFEGNLNPLTVRCTPTCTNCNPPPSTNTTATTTTTTQSSTVSRRTPSTHPRNTTSFYHVTSESLSSSTDGLFNTRASGMRHEAEEHDNDNTGLAVGLAMAMLMVAAGVTVAVVVVCRRRRSQQRKTLHGPKMLPPPYPEDNGGYCVPVVASAAGDSAAFWNPDYYNNTNVNVNNNTAATTTDNESHNNVCDNRSKRKKKKKNRSVTEHASHAANAHCRNGKANKTCVEYCNQAFDSDTVELEGRKEGVSRNETAKRGGNRRVTGGEGVGEEEDRDGGGDDDSIYENVMFDHDDRTEDDESGIDADESFNSDFEDVQSLDGFSAAPLGDEDRVYRNTLGRNNPSHDSVYRNTLGRINPSEDSSYRNALGRINPSEDSSYRNTLGRINPSEDNSSYRNTLIRNNPSEDSVYRNTLGRNDHPEHSVYRNTLKSTNCPAASAAIAALPASRNTTERGTNPATPATSSTSFASHPTSTTEGSANQGASAITALSASASHRPVPSAPSLNGNTYANETANPSLKNFDDDEEIYHELEPVWEYERAGTLVCRPGPSTVDVAATSSPVSPSHSSPLPDNSTSANPNTNTVAATSDGVSRSPPDDQRVHAESASGELRGAASAPPSDKGIASRVKGVGKKVMGLLPRRRKQDLTSARGKDEPAAVSQIELSTTAVPLSPSLSVSSPAEVASTSSSMSLSHPSLLSDNSNSTSFNTSADGHGGRSRHRRLPIIPDNEVPEEVARLPNLSDDNVDDIALTKSLPANDSTGIYDLAKPVEDSIDPRNDPPLTLPADNTATSPGIPRTNKKADGRDRGARNEYENQIPQGIVAEIRRVAQLRDAAPSPSSPPPPSSSPPVDEDGNSFRNESIQTSRAVPRKDQQGYTLVEGNKGRTGLQVSTTDGQLEQSQGVCPVSDDATYHHINSMPGRVRTAAHNYDHVSLDYDVPPSPSHSATPAHNNTVDSEIGEFEEDC